ncbi:MAG: helix-turn-helix domain-containing protein [Polyangiaceae bacterium]
MAPWTGNVRQLQNVVRQLVVQGREEPTLVIGKELDGLLKAAPGAQSDRSSHARTAHDAAGHQEDRPTTKARRPQDITDDEILAALEQTGFRRAAAADRLGIARSSLYARVASNKRLSRARELTADEVTSTLEKHGGDVVATAAALEISPHGLKLRMHALGLGDPR